MGRGDTTDRLIGFALVAKDNDLDGYIFQDENHARGWLAQKYIADEGYGVKLISYKERRCCRAPYAIKTLRQMKGSEFLKTKRWTKKGKIINPAE